MIDITSYDNFYESYKKHFKANVKITRLLHKLHYVYSCEIGGF